MVLGILVNTNKFKNLLVGLTQKAIERGHQVMLFFMDEGTHLLEDSKIQELKDLTNTDLSFCEHSAKHLGVNIDNIPDGITSGSQYNNARMIHDADKIIVL